MGYRRYVKEFFTNWREYDASTPEKIRLTLKNRAITAKRIATQGKGCCGHHGEPGC